MKTTLEIALLGGVSISIAPAPAPRFASRKVEALIAYLACSKRPISRETLADLLWGERPQRQAMSNLRVLLSSLRRELGPYFLIDRQTVALNQASRYRIDVSEFERSVATALHVASTQEGLPRHVVAQLERAVALYRGDFLEGFHIPNSQGFDAWLTVEQERLRGIVIEALRALVVHELACGDYMAGLRHVARLVRFDPFQEDARRHMMQLLDLCGQRGAALAHYRAYYSILAEELDTVPAAETLALYERIRVGRPVEP